MDELSNFCKIIKNKLGDKENLSIGQARETVNSTNNFLYSNYDGIGKTYALGTSLMGQTGWTSAYTKQDEGGGGLMA